MTPDAIEALRDVAEAVSAHTAQGADLNAALLADQEQARALADERFTEARVRENRRFRQVNRALAGLGVGIIVALVLLTGVLVSLILADRDRDVRSALSTDQRECSDILTADALVRVSIYATSRGAADPVAISRLRDRVVATKTDPSQLDDLRDEVETILRVLPSDTNGLREDASRANDRLLRVREICYRGQPADDPLAQ